MAFITNQNKDGATTLAKWLEMSNPRQIDNPFPVTGFVNMWNLKPVDAEKVLARLKG